MINFEQWEGFEGRIWKEEVNVRDFIQKNYTPYDGDESFLAGPTEATDKLWGALQKLQKDVNQELKLKVDEINSLAGEIATLNKQINTIELTGVKANELRDRRTLLIDQLSEIVDVDVTMECLVDVEEMTAQSYSL